MYAFIDKQREGFGVEPIGDGGRQRRKGEHKLEKEG